MPGGFIRRYPSDPTLAELTAIEGVVIIDRDPPATLTGIPAGIVCLVGEFEDGEYEPRTVVNGQDLLSTYGGFGFSYAGVPGNNPCARARRADGALVPEYWNGNGYIALANKRFGGLVITRVDTSVGEVQFTRLASILGGSDFTFSLLTGQILAFDPGSGVVNATFTGAVATVTSAAGVYPTTFTGGEQLVLRVDGQLYTVTFLAADQTQAQAIARVNQTLGYTAFTSVSATTIRFDGRIAGLDGEIEIVSQSGLVATALGFSVGTTNGTGNVGNLAAVTTSEISARVTAASAGVLVDRDLDGRLRLVNQAGGGTGTLEIDGTTTATALGFTAGATADATEGDDGVIPAGTPVRNVGGRELVTAQSVSVTADDAGPYSVKVRHATDDGSGLSFAVSTATVLPNPIALGAFSVTNAESISAALSESAIDALYVLAIAKTKKVATDAKQATVVVSARQSNAVRNALRTNAIEAPREGCFGRVACIRPPLGTTTRAQARSSTAQPGVGAYRNQNVIFNFPGVQNFIPTIALRGLGGGAGFTADGIVDVGSDVWLASLLSQLNPEENPGQVTDLITGMLGIERGNPDVQSLGIDDYTAFKAAGICAPRFDGGDAIFQSGVTSVDPQVTPQLVNIKRRRMSYYIQDSLAGPVNRYSKKLATTARKALIVGEIDGFMAGLLSQGNPDAARIAGYEINTRDVNTPAEEALGIFRVKLLVRLLASLDVIVLDVTAGESVTITEAA